MPSKTTAVPKGREPSPPAPDPGPAPGPTPTLPPPTLPMDPSAVEALLKRAARGDASCVPELKALFEHPAALPILRACGSPPEWLEKELVESASGENLAIREALLRKLAEVRRELEGPNPSPIERLLAERAAICWWIVHRFESAAATARDPSIPLADFHQRRIDRAHGRFLSSLKTLATVRKLALPALQVNIGMNQLNTIEPGDRTAARPLAKGVKGG